MKKLFFYLLPFCSFTIHVFATDSDNQPKWSLKDINTDKPVYIIHNDKLIGLFDMSILDYIDQHEALQSASRKYYFKTKKQEPWQEKQLENMDSSQKMSFYHFVKSISKNEPIGVYIKTEGEISDSFLPSGEIPMKTEQETGTRTTGTRTTGTRTTETGTRLFWLLPVGVCIGVIVTLGIEASIRYIRTCKKNIRYSKNGQRSKKLH